MPTPIQLGLYSDRKKPGGRKKSKQRKGMRKGRKKKKERKRERKEKKNPAPCEASHLCYVKSSPPHVTPAAGLAIQKNGVRLQSSQFLKKRAALSLVLVVAWTLEYTNSVSKLGTFGGALVWVESSLLRSSSLHPNLLLF